MAELVEVRSVTGDEFETELAREEPCVVEFWMIGCPACARFAPSYGEVAQEYAGRANVVAIEARENIELARKYGINGVPTVIIFKAGEEVDRATGARSTAELRAWLEAML